MSPEPIAIVGMALRAPGANDLHSFWANIRAGKSALRDAPSSRIPEEFFHPVRGAGSSASKAEIRPLEVRRGGFIDDELDVDIAGLGIPPRAAGAIEPDQLLALTVAADAIHDAGVDRTRFDGSRWGVVLGRGGYLAPAAIRFSNRVRSTRQIVATLRESLPDVDEHTFEDVISRVVDASVSEQGTDIVGLVSNFAASRIANRLDLHGPAYTVDGACASSLLAIDQAISELRRGRCDTVLAGGIHHCQEPSFWSVFSEMRALSASGMLRAFDVRADGTLIGEATGILVLKRLVDARADGDRIYASILGTGVSSDGRASSLVSPYSPAQARALAQAWTESEIDPRSRGAIGLLEGHGTGTPSGDGAELETIRTVFGPRLDDEPQPGIGTVKSIIGHTMPAAGAMGVIKAALALYHRTIPPTVGCEQPHPDLCANSRFAPIPTAKVWEATSNIPRRAAVNAFGFGGINAHAVLEESSHPEDSDVQGECLEGPDQGRIERISASSLAVALRDETNSRHSTAGSGQVRLVKRTNSPTRFQLLVHEVSKGVTFVSSKDVVASSLAASGQPRLLAFVFAGMDAMLPNSSEEPGGLDFHELVRTSFSDAMRWDERLRAGGLFPDIIAGISMGEIAALSAASALRPEIVREVLDNLPWETLGREGGASAVVGASRALLEHALAGTGVQITHENTPNQCIIAGAQLDVARVMAVLTQRGISSHVVALPSEFHTGAALPIVQSIGRISRPDTVRSPSIPVWSAASAAPYPGDPEQFLTLMMSQFALPVRLPDLARRLYEAGVRMFISIGAGNTSALVTSSLDGRPHASIGVGQADMSIDEQIAWAKAVAWSVGRADGVLATAAKSESRGYLEKIKLSLGVPLLSVGTRPSGPTLWTNATGDWSSQAPQLEPVTTTFKVSLETMPYLKDHTFFHQRADWPSDEDRWPVVPGTTILELMRTVVSRVAGASVVKVNDLQLKDWLVAAPPRDIEATITQVSAGVFDVALDRFATARLVTGEFPSRPPRATCHASSTPPERPSPFTALDAYRTRRLFHGPAFQGLVEIAGLGPRHIRGTLRALATPGALLDSAGQLFGCWLISSTSSNTRMLPKALSEAEFFSPMPIQGELVDCHVTVDGISEEEVSASIELTVDGRLLARLRGWTNRRFANDERTQAAEAWPEYRAISRRTTHGWVLAEETWGDLASRQLVARNYLNSTERQEMESVNPTMRRQWLLGRIAAKDSVRYLLWSEGEREVFPAEIQISNLESGKPIVRGVNGRDLVGIEVSISHTQEFAAAIASRTDCGLGIDLEIVQTMSAGANDIAFSHDELTLLDNSPLASDLAKLVGWSTKEAAAKSLGLSLTSPRLFKIVGVDPQHRLHLQYDTHEVAVNWGMMPCDDGQRSLLAAWTNGAGVEVFSPS